MKSLLKFLLALISNLVVWTATLSVDLGLPLVLQVIVALITLIILKQLFREDWWVASASILMGCWLVAVASNKLQEMLLFALLIVMGIILASIGMIFRPTISPNALSQRSRLRSDVMGAMTGFAIGWLIFAYSCPTPWWEIPSNFPHAVALKIQGCISPIKYDANTQVWAFASDWGVISSWFLIATIRNPLHWGIWVSALTHEMGQLSFGRWFITSIKGFLVYTFFVGPLSAPLLMLPLMILVILMGVSETEAMLTSMLSQLETQIGADNLILLIYVAMLSIFSLVASLGTGLSVWFFSRNDPNVKLMTQPPNTLPNS